MVGDEQTSLEGWVPEVGAGVTLDEVIDRAFDYRGDVTVVMTDGRGLVGYVYNRSRDVAEPFLQLFDASGAGHVVPYSDVSTIHFTGKDTAAGKSYEAWLRRKADARAERTAAPDA